MRKTSALVVAAALLTTVTACTSDASASCTPRFDSGEASRLVNASGSFGSEPEVTFPTPLLTDSTEVTEIEPGEGDTLKDGQVVDFQVSIFLGDSGELLTASSYDDAEPIRRTAGDEDDIFGSILQCATEGSRIAATTTVADVYGADALDPSLGLENEDTLVIVADVVRGFLGRADGADQLGVAGMPAVVLSPEGVPGISLPNEEPPSDLRIAELKRGSGEKVEEGDRVVLHYTGLLWEEDRVFQSTWETLTPATLVAESMEDSAGGSGLVPGFAEALIGQRVGSQVLAVIPPEFGYPEGASPAEIPAGSTLVFVFDVLGIE